MTNQDPTWYVTRRKLDSKRDGLEQAALKSLRSGRPNEAQEYAKQADSLKFCRSSPPVPKYNNNYHYSTERIRRPKTRPSTRPPTHPSTHPQIGGVVPVRVIRRKRRTQPVTKKEKT
uniref:Uncharacterized protein n=1 Tax=Pithovirus LCPAC201 TaxID=2506591 RepID=A0A481Z7X4_9VIRU|nr:MAG: hypothetical protein LCPAC201_01120 [Pithovirus LCPAC201]